MTQRFPNPYPMRKVVEARSRSGQGGLLSPQYFSMRWWDLKLECGHEVERTRSVSYPKGERVLEGFARMHHPPPDIDENVKPPPKRVRCEFCPRRICGDPNMSHDD